MHRCLSLIECARCTGRPRIEITKNKDDFPQPEEKSACYPITGFEEYLISFTQELRNPNSNVRVSGNVMFISVEASSSINLIETIKGSESFDTVEKIKCKILKIPFEMNIVNIHPDKDDRTDLKRKIKQLESTSMDALVLVYRITNEAKTREAVECHLRDLQSFARNLFAGPAQQPPMRFIIGYLMEENPSEVILDTDGMLNDYAGRNGFEYLSLYENRRLCGKRDTKDIFRRIAALSFINVMKRRYAGALMMISSRLRLHDQQVEEE